jgi:hypothetical protein
LTPAIHGLNILLAFVNVLDRSRALLLSLEWRETVRLSPGVPLLAVLLPVMAYGQAETEPNNTKAQANPFTLPAATTTGVIVGNSTLATGTGLDYFLVTTAAQAAPGFYRHRLLCTSATAGHTVNIRGLDQVAGVPGTTDSLVQESVATTTPPRFIQWYTSEAPATLYVRVNGAAATTADYRLDYEVQPATVIATNWHFPPGTLTLTTVGQSAPQTDTDFWVYEDSTRAPVATFGNDDELGTASPGSALTRFYPSAVYHLAISDRNLANNLGSPADDDFRTGTVTDFPGVLVNSSAAVGVDLDWLLGPVPITATKTAPFEVVFLTFATDFPVELMDFRIE